MNWQALDAVHERHRVAWHWIKVHIGTMDNKTADRLIKEGIDSLNKTL